MVCNYMKIPLPPQKMTATEKQILTVVFQFGIPRSFDDIMSRGWFGGGGQGQNTQSQPLIMRYVQIAYTWAATKPTTLFEWNTFEQFVHTFFYPLFKLVTRGYHTNVRKPHPSPVRSKQKKKDRKQLWGTTENMIQHAHVPGVWDWTHAFQMKIPRPNLLRKCGNLVRALR